MMRNNPGIRIKLTNRILRPLKDAQSGRLKKERSYLKQMDNWPYDIDLEK